MRLSMITVLFIALPLVLLAQGDERLFCGACGKPNALFSSFCFHCGSRLDKSALIARLKARVATADSLDQQVTFSPAEVSLLIREESESRAREFIRSGAKLPPTRPKTQVEKTLDVVVPIIVGATAIFFLRQALYP